MQSQGVEESRQFLGQAPAMSSSAYATYDTLMRQSRKLGRTATQAISGARQGAQQVFGQKVKRVPVVGEDVVELKKVVAHSREVLVNAKTVLPFFFPHEMILDRTKISIIKRNFFWSADVISIRVEDILNVSVSVGPVFGAVTVASRVMSTIDHFKIDHFWRSDATRLKEIIQGYLIARQNGLRTDHLSCEELASTLLELGREL
jgi:hypothetical protein